MRRQSRAAEAAASRASREPARPRGAIRRFLRLVHRPHAATFAENLRRAHGLTMYVSLLCLAVLASVTTYLEGRSLNSHFALGIGFATLIVTLIATLIAMPVAMPVAFRVTSGLLYGIARLLGGRGSFLRHCFAFNVYQAPILVSGLVLPLVLLPHLPLASLGPPGNLLGIAGNVLDVAVSSPSSCSPYPPPRGAIASAQHDW